MAFDLLCCRIRAMVDRKRGEDQILRVYSDEWVRADFKRVSRDFADFSVLGKERQLVVREGLFTLFNINTAHGKVVKVDRILKVLGEEITRAVNGVDRARSSDWHESAVARFLDACFGETENKRNNAAKETHQNINAVVGHEEEAESRYQMALERDKVTGTGEWHQGPLARNRKHHLSQMQNGRDKLWPILHEAVKIKTR